MARIFISYRREDSESETGRIYDRLVQHYDKDSVLMDVDSIYPGDDFRERINELLLECQVMAAVVGPRWAGPVKRGQLRIDDEKDWVRIEIEAALKRKIPVIPILVKGAEMPKPSSLPEKLQDFAFRQALVIGRQQDFHPHVDRLIKALDATLASRAVAPAQVATSQIVVPEESKFDNSRDRHLFGPGSKRLLAIDGGGIRIGLALAFLERLEAVIAAHPAYRDGGSKPKLCDFFDLVGGTSIGAAVATLLAFGFSVREILELFFEISPKVFRRSFWRVAGLQAKLEWRNWRRELDVVFGDRSLDTPDLVTGLAILVKRIDTGVSWGLANNPRAAYWDTPPDNSYFGNRRYRIADLIQASMAMPTYFEPVELPMITGEGKGLFVDASMGIHNNPSLFLFMMSVLRYYGLCWKTGVDDLTIASIGTGTFRHQLSMGRFNLARQLQLAIHGLTSMMSEADAFILSQMQFLGECPTPWQVNSEIGTLTGERAAPPLFRFFRYDVRLETPWLRDQLGIDMSEQQVVALRAIDDPSSFPRLYEIGTAAAERQVKPEHWLPHPA